MNKKTVKHFKCPGCCFGCGGELEYINMNMPCPNGCPFTVKDFYDNTEEVHEAFEELIAFRRTKPDLTMEDIHGIYARHKKDRSQLTLEDQALFAGLGIKL